MAQREGTAGINIYKLGSWTSELEFVQNTVRIIVMTNVDSIPHMPTYGGGANSYIGAPATEAPALLSDIYTTLEEFLPTWLEVTSVNAVDIDNLAENKLNVEINIKNIDTNQNQIVSL
jgi:phage baseplate assembly protein W